MGENGTLSASDVALLTGNGGNRNDSMWGDSSFFWIFALLILANGGFGNWGNNGNNGGFGGGDAAGTLPYFFNTQTQNDVNRGFSDLHIADQIAAVQSAVTSGFGDTALGIAGINQTICQTGAGINQNISQTGNGIVSAVNGGFANAETAANARQIANMQQAFNSQVAVTGGLTNLSSQLAQCCCDNRLATCQTQNVIQTEAASTRFADANNTRDILTNATANTQAILDKLCQLELDGVKAQVEAKNDRIAELQAQLNMANLAASQTAQNAFIQKGFTDEVDQLYNRLSSCPVPSTPVYGRTPIFTCNQNNGYGCGCGGGSI